MMLRHRNLKIGRASSMIPDDEPFVFYDPKAPENQPPPPTPGLVEALEADGWRPFGYEF